jgi:hypothetical protein
MTEKQAIKSPMLRVRSLHDFRPLFLGTTTSLLGDQFAPVATPRLVLRLTGGDSRVGQVVWRICQQ